MRILSFFLLSALAAATSAQTVLTSAVYSGHTYSLLSNSNWTDAEAKAVLMGGHLATIGSLAENDWVYGAFSRFGGVDRGLYIGLSDVDDDGTFVWSSGDAVTFTNWGAGEPANQGNDPYVHLFWPGDPRFSKWNDVPNVASFAGFPLNGVVEVVPEPATIAALGLSVLALVRRRIA